MFYDPFYMIVMGLGAVLMWLPQTWVKSTYEKFSKKQTRQNLTGAEVAEAILRDNGINDVVVEPTKGFLSDHYDPMAKKIRLSEHNYYERSVAGVTVSAHECGHAIQHAKGYFPVVLRSALVPAVNFGGGLGPWLIMIALMLGAGSAGMPEYAWLMGWLGVLLFGLSVLFHIVTLPVEIDASARALKILSNRHYLVEAEMPGAKKVLNAAAMTYVASALFSMIQLLYWAMRLMGSRRN